MAGLTGNTIASSYKSILRVNDNSNGIDATAETVTDGEGTRSALALSDDVVRVTPQNDDTTAAFSVRSKGGAGLLTVDTTNSVVKAGTTQTNVLTQYAYFGVTNTDSANFVDDTHHALPFMNSRYGNILYPPAFGTSTDPATTFTTSEGNGTRAADIVPCLWYVYDNITIDSVKYIFGADTASGDSNTATLLSFTFNSGSTSCLTSGTTLCETSASVNSDGSEQAILHSWDAPSNANVDAGKVIGCLVRGTSINSDNSWQVIVKYHIR